MSAPTSCPPFASPQPAHCSADTILRALKELARENASYMSDSGKSYDFNIADMLHSLLVKPLCSRACWWTAAHTPRTSTTSSSGRRSMPKPIYKKFADYSPGVAAIGEVIVSVENREGNAMYVFTSGTPWDGWRNPTYGLAVFVRTVVYARRGLWTWWGSIAGFSISAPTGVPRFMTTSSPCGDGKPKRLKAQASS